MVAWMAKQNNHHSSSSIGLHVRLAAHLRTLVRNEYAENDAAESSTAAAMPKPFRSHTLPRGGGTSAQDKQDHDVI
jgi:hypothetical protein